MLLTDALTGVSQLGIDTSPIIYFVEANPVYDARVTHVFEQISAGSVLGVTSVIPLTEVLVHPLRRNDTLLAQQYRDLLLTSQGFATLPISGSVAERAAGIRARYQVRTPDALQIATAVEVGCQAFLTNDTRLSRLREIRILVLDELRL